MTTAVLSLGSNLGDRLAHLVDAVAGLASLGDACRVVVVTVSDVYETPPWGDPDQPAYLNAVVQARAPLEPRDWLGLARRLEHEAGRIRDPARRYGPRPLDVDVIAVWTADGAAVVLDEPDLVLPHPRAHLRAFVLRPWLDLDPDAELPGHGRVADLLANPPAAADAPGVVRHAAGARLRGPGHVTGVHPA
jgi:2-amino-4-hydroxy-6-hydroxymethyldihydropteridine diphosphokinase